MTIIIHHIADCGTSRNMQVVIDALGETPVIVSHLDTGWTRPQRLALSATCHPGLSQKRTAPC